MCVWIMIIMNRQAISIIIHISINVINNIIIIKMIIIKMIIIIRSTD